MLFNLDLIYGRTDKGAAGSVTAGIGPVPTHCLVETGLDRTLGVSGIELHYVLTPGGRFACTRIKRRRRCGDGHAENEMSLLAGSQSV